MTDCIHGFPENQCATCSAADATTRGGAASGSGKMFALVYAPAFRDVTFLHLNREGDHWKMRWYPSPSQPPVELAQSAPSSSGPTRDLSTVELRHEIAYPRSTAPGGVTVRDSRYWFDTIARVNNQHADRIAALR